MRRSLNFSGERGEKKKIFPRTQSKGRRQSEVYIPPEIQAKTLTVPYNAILISDKIPKQRFIFHDIVNFA